MSNRRADLQAAAEADGWPFDLPRVANVAAALYDAAADGTATWAGPSKVVTLEAGGRNEIRTTLASLT